MSFGFGWKIVLNENPLPLCLIYIYIYIYINKNIKNFKITLKAISLIKCAFRYHLFCWKLKTLKNHFPVTVHF